MLPLKKHAIWCLFLRDAEDHTQRIFKLPLREQAGNHPVFLPHLHLLPEGLEGQLGARAAINPGHFLTWFDLVWSRLYLRDVYKLLITAQRCQNCFGSRRNRDNRESQRHRIVTGGQLCKYWMLNYSFVFEFTYFPIHFYTPIQIG